MATSLVSNLQEIPVERIDRNPENPRLVFRPDDLAELQESIRRYGVQVPITVYREGARYVLIDGERRWRCSMKLARKTIPAFVRPKPSSLENLLMMFNIHSLREQWDLLTISMKLPRIISLLTKEIGGSPTERVLSERTGLKRAVIRRCKLLIALPQEYRDRILAELDKPKSKQRITEDLFIELERALTTVERAMPEVIPDRDVVRRTLLEKFESEVISNRVLFRQVGKIARAEKVDADPEVARDELQKLFSRRKYTIEQAYKNSVGDAYAERSLNTRINGLLSSLDGIDPEELEDDVLEGLKILEAKISRLLRGES